MSLADNGIEKFEIVKVYNSESNPDWTPLYQLQMHETNLDVEIFCESEYKNNIELIKQLLEKHYVK